MKCPNCGSHLEDGNLFCEVCGEEINIVPEYDPDVDISVDIDGVFDHTKEIDIPEVKRQKKVPRSRSEYYEKNKHVSREQVIDSVDDWEDDEVGEISAIKDVILSVVDFWNRNIFSKIFILLVVLLIAAGVLGCVFLVKKLADRQSVEYLIEQAETSYRNKDYETAIDYYEKAIDKDPDNISRAGMSLSQAAGIPSSMSLLTAIQPVFFTALKRSKQRRVTPSSLCSLTISFMRS